MILSLSLCLSLHEDIYFFITRLINVLPEEAVRRGEARRGGPQV